jgi:hemolysin activation/secretion protein
MKGLAIVRDISSLSKVDLNQLEGLYVDSDSALIALKEKLESLCLNVEITRDNLLLIKNEILKFYQDHAQHLVSVEIPEQDVSSGVVTFVVNKAKIGNVSYRGNRWFSKRRVEKQLSLHSGDTLDEDSLLNDIAWLNQNPFHYTEAVLSPGKNKSETDIEILTKDRFPLRLYTGADNTGIESTGRGRYFVGATWGNAFFVDDFLSYQFTTNSTYDRFHSHVMNYISYLPCQHILNIYGGYSKIEPDISNFHSHGKEAQLSLRYKLPFQPLYTQFQHQLYFGFDYKYITSALFFVAELNTQSSLMNARVNVYQEMLGYQLEYTPSHHQFTFQIELYGSPAEWLPHQSQHAYSELRAHAKPRYFYGTLALGDIYTFSSKEAISFLLRGQGSVNPLVPSEQFKLGGYNTVRGYEESVFISDNGICANFEVRSRPLSFFKKAKDQLTFLAFMDYGWGGNYHAFDGIKKSATLWGTGPGLRYTINPYLNIRVDYGFKLHHVKFDGNDLGMWHVGASLSY